MGDQCRLLAADLHGFVDGRLSPGGAARVRAHLATCAACAAEVEALRDLRRRLAGLAEPLPADFGERLQRRLRAARPEPRPRPWWVAGPVLAAAMAGFVGAAVLATPVRLPAAARPASIHATAFHPVMAAPQATVTMSGAEQVASAAGAEELAPFIPPPTAEALTVVANSPAAAMAGLSRLAAADGGQALATTSAHAAEASGRQAALTLRADIPPTALSGFNKAVGRYGSVIATVAAPAASGTAPAAVHVLVTVLEPVATAATHTTGSAISGWRARLVQTVGRNWAWAVGAVALVAVATLVVTRVRQVRSG